MKNYLVFDTSNVGREMCNIAILRIEDDEITE
jgi:hypothetical protein